MAPPVTNAQAHANAVWHGEGVTISDVLQALSEIRLKFAQAEAGDDEHPRPRNCVMTLIGVASSDEHEQIAMLTTQTIGVHHPAQAIVIREGVPSSSGRLDAWISTEVARPEIGCAIECELVTVHVDGKAAGHIGGLLDPLLVAGVPTYLWWLGTPPFGERELVDALRVCDGLVVDSAQFEEPYNTFHRMSSMLKVVHHRLGFADAQWSRLRPWREMVAQFFTPVDRRPFLSGISELGVDYAGEGRGNRIAAALLTGWVASALGWKLRRATAGGGGVVVAIYELGGMSIEVNFRSVPVDGHAPGQVTAVRIAGASHGTSFRLSVTLNPPRRRTARELPDVERRHPDTERVLLTMIEIADSEPLRHVQQLESDDTAALLLDVLSTGAHDEVYNRALASAEELMSKV